MLDLLLKAVRGGFKTSEFWLALAAMVVVPVLDPIVSKVLEAIAGYQAGAHSPVIIAVLAGCAAFVSAAYSYARAIVKREQVAQIPTVAVLQQQLPNVVSPGPGSAELERAHAIRAGADPATLR